MNEYSGQDRRSTRRYLEDLKRRERAEDWLCLGILAFALLLLVLVVQNAEYLEAFRLLWWPQ